MLCFLYLPMGIADSGKCYSEFPRQVHNIAFERVANFPPVPGSGLSPVAQPFCLLCNRLHWLMAPLAGLASRDSLALATALIGLLVAMQMA